MAKQEALAALKDIHLPAPISWWPLAWGWYALILIILFFILYSLYFYSKKKEQGLAKKQALVLLQHYKKEYQKHHNAALTSSQISALLKRVALAHYPRNQVAALHGHEWIVFLNKTSKMLDFSTVKSLLLDLPYKADEHSDLDPLFALASLWIKQRGPSCSN